MRDKMSAIEFSNERSSENEMDWIRKTNAILSSKLSHHQTEDATRREILYDRTTRAREKKNTKECVVVLSRRTISILVYTERSSLSRVKVFRVFFLCGSGKSFCKKEQKKSKIFRLKF